MIFITFARAVKHMVEVSNESRNEKLHKNACTLTNIQLFPFWAYFVQSYLNYKLSLLFMIKEGLQPLTKSWLSLV